MLRRETDDPHRGDRPCPYRGAERHGRAEGMGRDDTVPLPDRGCERGRGRGRRLRRSRERTAARPGRGRRRWRRTRTQPWIETYRLRLKQVVLGYLGAVLALAVTTAIVGDERTAMAGAVFTVMLGFMAALPLWFGGIDLGSWLTGPSGSSKSPWGPASSSSGSAGSPSCSIWPAWRSSAKSSPSPPTLGNTIRACRDAECRGSRSGTSRRTARSA